MPFCALGAKRHGTGKNLQQMKAAQNAIRNKLIESQQWVISLQEHVINCSEKQLRAVQTTVKSTVED